MVETRKLYEFSFSKKLQKYQKHTKYIIFNMFVKIGFCQDSTRRSFSLHYHVPRLIFAFRPLFMNVESLIFRTCNMSPGPGPLCSGCGGRSPPLVFLNLYLQQYTHRTEPRINQNGVQGPNTNSQTSKYTQNCKNVQKHRGKILYIWPRIAQHILVYIYNIYVYIGSVYTLHPRAIMDLDG